MSFQKIYGLYGLEHHTVEINGDVTMRTDNRTSEYSATQSMDNVRLSFAIPGTFQPTPKYPQPLHYGSINSIRDLKYLKM